MSSFGIKYESALNSKKMKVFFQTLTAMEAKMGKSCFTFSTLVSILLFFCISSTAYSNPTLVYDINPDGDGVDGGFVTFQGKLYFKATDGVHGNELWVYDGVNSPIQISNINPDHDETSLGGFAVFNSKLYFWADSGINNPTLWVYDGESSPTMIPDSDPNGYKDPKYFTVFDSKLYFSAGDEENGSELWVYDGGNPPEMVADINPDGGSSPTHLTVFNTTLYFGANDGTNGHELWEYDGVNPPKMVDNINKNLYEIVEGDQKGSSNPAGFSVFDSKLFFTANDAINGYELWVYDGDNPPTMIADINTLPYSYMGHGSSYPREFTYFNSKLYFFAMGNSSKLSLWVYDGDNPPEMVPDLHEELWPDYLVVFNSRLFFSGTRDNYDFHARELWAYDGVTQPVMLTEMFPYGKLNGAFSYLTVFNSNLYFLASGLGKGRELWVYKAPSTPMTPVKFVPSLLPLLLNETQSEVK